MELRPCIDIHNGKVKQIIGSTLTDLHNQARENYVSVNDAAYYAQKYRSDNLRGGHIILLNPVTSTHYSATKNQALKALAAYPGGMQIGGGVTPENAAAFLAAGASHVIVTSYVFHNGNISYDNLERIKQEVGREHLVLDVSCRKKDGRYYVVTDRWQKFTETEVDIKLLEQLKDYASEFLIHAVDVEGKAAGIESALVSLLGIWGKVPITYAGGVGNFEHLQELKELGNNKLNVTIGSALDIFGGHMEYQKVIEWLAK
jgi:phosphoribosylformimino-5-aminoimidazole carboxamide ribotide isomerase